MFDLPNEMKSSIMNLPRIKKPAKALMELPINDKELKTIVSALRLGGDAALYQKIKLIQDIREQYPGNTYKKIAREQFGYVI